MSKSANSGQLRTPVYFKMIEKKVDNDQKIEGIDNLYDFISTYSTITYILDQEEKEMNIFGEGKCVRAKWVNAHGTDSFVALQMKLREPATITCRYSPKIKVDQVVYRGDDPKPFEIISIDNVEERNQWLEIKVQRKVQAR